MAWFKKKQRILDLTENYNRINPEKPKTNTDVLDLTKSDNSNSQKNIFTGLFNNSDNSTPTNENSSLEERKHKLATRLKNMTEKLEDISNQIYHLQQRVELIERKADVGRY